MEKIFSREGFGKQRLMALPCPEIRLPCPPIVFPCSPSVSAALHSKSSGMGAIYKR
jgi:hypothetical protein